MTYAPVTTPELLVETGRALLEGRVACLDEIRDTAEALRAKCMNLRNIMLPLPMREDPAVLPDHLLQWAQAVDPLLAMLQYYRHDFYQDQAPEAEVRLEAQVEPVRPFVPVIHQSDEDDSPFKSDGGRALYDRSESRVRRRLVGTGPRSGPA